MNKIIDTLNTQKAAIYIRVSTHHQIDKDSLPLQREDLINYAKYALNIDNYEIFEDAGYSAKNTERPSYQYMMSKLRTGEFSHLLVWKIDRISRNLLDFATMYEELKTLGVTFVSKNEQFDTSSAIGEAMLKIILVFAELERNMTSERVSAVMLSRATNGQWNGGRVPYGYNYDKSTKQFSIHPIEGNHIKKLYDLYLETQSMLAVAKYFNEHGIKTKTGNNWSPTKKKKILASRFYLGEYQYNLHKDSIGGAGVASLKPEDEWITVKDHHPAIVSIEQWDKCAEIRAYNHRRSNAPKRYRRKNTHIFAGLIICGECGSTYQATIDRARTGGYRPSIYLCSRRKQYSDCQNKYMSDITLGPFILNYISNIIKANANMGKTTTPDMFKKKLLRGDVFKDVKDIAPSGLNEMYNMIVSKKFNSDPFTSAVNRDESQPDFASERELLISEKRKYLRALDRLKTLYLYNDNAMAEKDYIIENKNILDNLKRVDERLEEIEKNSSQNFTITDSEFIEKASYFIISQELSNQRYINFNSLIQHIDTNVLKNFIQSVIKKIVVLDGRIISIQFKNGIEHDFLY